MKTDPPDPRNVLCAREASLQHRRRRVRGGRRMTVDYGEIIAGVLRDTNEFRQEAAAREAQALLYYEAVAAVSDARVRGFPLPLTSLLESFTLGEPYGPRVTFSRYESRLTMRSTSIPSAALPTGVEINEEWTPGEESAEDMKQNVRRWIQEADETLARTVAPTLTRGAPPIRVQ